MDRISVAIWGIGNHARRNLIPALVACENTDLVGVWTRSEEVRSDVAAEHETKSYTSIDEMLSDASVDAIVVATPVGLHHRHGLAVLEAGKHLWCEKSLTATLDDSLELISLAKEADLALCECFMFPHHPQFTKVKHLMDTGAIGTIHSIRAVFEFPHLDPDDIRYSAALGGGALLDAGCYPVAVARLIAGENPDQIESHLESEHGCEVDTSGSTLLRFPSGLHSHLEWGFGRAYRNEIEVWGDEGILRIERAFSKPADLETSIMLRLQSGEEEIKPIPPANHFELMFSAFSRTVSERSHRLKWWSEAEDQARVLAAVRGEQAD